VTLTGSATSLSDPTKVYSFGAIVTINPGESGPGARGVPVSDPALPGASPICKERILQLGGLNLKFSQGGTLLVSIDPTGWFSATSGIDFSNLQPILDSANPICVMDPNSLTLYENRGPCGKGGTCPDGQLCQTGTNECVVPCDNDGACSGGYVCNTSDGNCIPQYCIPDTNWAACSNTNENCGVTQGAAAAGQGLFLGILGGGTAAYSVSYTTPDGGA
jgi:hypothetical protein